MSGYTSERAQPHNQLVIEYADTAKAFHPKLLPVDGYAPDIQIRIAGVIVYIDVKIPTKQNLAIACDLFEHQESNWKPTVYAWKRHGKWFHANHRMLRQVMIGGRRPPTINGSNTDWYCFASSNIEC